MMYRGGGVGRITAPRARGDQKMMSEEDLVGKWSERENIFALLPSCPFLALESMAALHQRVEWKA